MKKIYEVLAFVLGALAIGIGIVGGLIDAANNNKTTCAATVISRKLFDKQEAFEKKKNGEKENKDYVDFPATHNYNHHDIRRLNYHGYNTNTISYDDNTRSTIWDKIANTIAIIIGFIKFAIIGCLIVLALLLVAYVIVNMRQPLDPANLVPIIK